MKKTVLLIVIAILGVAAATPSNPPAPSDCEPGEYVLRTETYFEGVRTYQSQICPQAGTLTLIYTDRVGTNPPASRDATAAETANWIRGALLQEVATSETNLSADVDTGQKWVPKLRDWQTDAQNYYAQWPAMSDAVKDAVTREMVRRMGLTWGGLADLLTVLDKGR